MSLLYQCCQNLMLSGLHIKLLTLKVYVNKYCLFVLVSVDHFTKLECFQWMCYKEKDVTDWYSVIHDQSLALMSKKICNNMTTKISGTRPGYFSTFIYFKNNHIWHTSRSSFSLYYTSLESLSYSVHLLKDIWQKMSNTQVKCNGNGN